MGESGLFLNKFYIRSIVGVEFWGYIDSKVIIILLLILSIKLIRLYVMSSIKMVYAQYRREIYSLLVMLNHKDYQSIC